MNKKLYVGNLPYDISKSDIESIFNEFGEIASINIITDQYTGKAKGFGFVEMVNSDDAQNAQQGLDGKEFRERNLRINFAMDRNDNNSGRRQNRNRY